MTNSRHDTLIAAGWRYDTAQDRYTPPGEAQAGTERWYNLDAAWSAYQQAQQSTPSRRTRAKDPREQEPQ